MRPRILSDLNVMRGKDVPQWYGDVMGAWGSLNHNRPTLWRNLGYWNDRRETLDQAAGNLATRLADAAQVRAGCDVLDVGCGLGESTFLLRDRLDQRDSKLVGLDITERHIDLATARRVGDRPEFFVGSATDMPFDDESFDRILALECAFHFPDRRRFFAEALRVLRPGGLLGVADVVVTPGPVRMRRWVNTVLPRRARRRIEWFESAVLKTPSANLVTFAEYLDQLRGAGFVTPGS